jgi:hypothetical protein
MDEITSSRALALSGVFGLTLDIMLAMKSRFLSSVAAEVGMKDATPLRLCRIGLMDPAENVRDPVSRFRWVPLEEGARLCGRSLRRLVPAENCAMLLASEGIRLDSLLAPAAEENGARLYELGIVLAGAGMLAGSPSALGLSGTFVCRLGIREYIFR